MVSHGASLNSHALGIQLDDERARRLGQLQIEDEAHKRFRTSLTENVKTSSY